MCAAIECMGDVMADECLFQLTVKDAEGRERIVKAIQRTTEVQFLEDQVPRRSVENFLCLDDGRRVERKSEKVLQSTDGSEIFEIIGKA